MAVKSKRHIHKYHKVNAAFVKLWACALPDCNHHMPKHLEEFVLGKASICWNCDAQMVIDEESYKMDKPFCINCLHPASSDDLLKHLESLAEKD
jgi:hypothetical protein